MLFVPVEAFEPMTTSLLRQSEAPSAERNRKVRLGVCAAVAEVPSPWLKFFLTRPVAAVAGRDHGQAGSVIFVFELVARH